MPITTKIVIITLFIHLTMGFVTKFILSYKMTELEQLKYEITGELPEWTAWLGFVFFVNILVGFGAACVGLFRWLF